MFCFMKLMSITFNTELYSLPRPFNEYSKIQSMIIVRILWYYFIFQFTDTYLNPINKSKNIDASFLIIERLNILCHWAKRVVDPTN